MTHEVLGIIWYWLLSILWIGFIVLEGFTSGVGMLFGKSKTELEGRVLQMTVGPYWDGSEVWFITAGGATFAAFPLVYAELFSSLYVALYLILIMMITRGVSMELVYKDDNKTWQKGMQLAWIISSYGLALLLGVRFANLFLKANTISYLANDFFGLLNKMGLLGGLLFIAFYRLLGVLWLQLKAKGDVIDRVAKSYLAPAIIIALTMPVLMMGYNWDSNLFSTNYQTYPVLWALPVLAMILPIATLILGYMKKWGLTFVTTVLSVIFYMLVGYSGIYPYMAPGITLYDGMASKLTLTIMTWVAGFFVPLILGYQGWKFYHFRHKISESFFTK